MQGEFLIQTENVSKTYSRGLPDELTALHDVTIDICRGEVSVFKGPSGSGKTTLLSLIGCMSRPTSGRIVIDGKDIVKLPERFLTNIRRQKFGFIFQQFNLIRNVSVFENILLPLYPLETRFSEMKERARTLLKKLGIESKKNHKVKKLSGGEQQRVAIARALINNPAVIIAGEPSAHLDTELSREIMDIFSILKKEGKTILIATHDPFIHDHPLVNSVVTMRDGRLDRITEK